MLLVESGAAATPFDSSHSGNFGFGYSQLTLVHAYNCDGFMHLDILFDYNVTGVVTLASDCLDEIVHFSLLYGWCAESGCQRRSVRMGTKIGSAWAMGPANERIVFARLASDTAKSALSCALNSCAWRIMENASRFRSFVVMVRLPI